LDVKKTIIFNLRWHRRIGLSVFFMVIFLSVTGFALNHSPGLKLSKVDLSSNWLLSWYGLEQEPAEGFNVDENWVYLAADQQLYFNQNIVAGCSAPLHSVAATEQMILALCTDSIVMLSHSGQLIESFSQLQGLPANIDRVAVDGNNIFLTGSQGTSQFDPDSLNITAIDQVRAESISAQPLPDKRLSEIADTGTASISLETVILDLHSGRFFGNAGVLFVDIIGLLMCILSITGLWAWVNHQRLRKQ